MRGCVTVNMSYYDLVLLAAAGAVWMDFRWAKVANEWVVVCLMAGLTAQVIRNGPAGILEALAGAAAAALLLGWLFCFRMLGAGDIKILMALGAFLGPGEILVCILAAFLVGAFQSILIMAVNRIFIERMCYLVNYLMTEAGKKSPAPYRKGSVERSENFHFTLPVLCGVIWVVFR